MEGGVGGGGLGTFTIELTKDSSYYPYYSKIFIKLNELYW